MSQEKADTLLKCTCGGAAAFANISKKGAEMTTRELTMLLAAVRLAQTQLDEMYGMFQGCRDDTAMVVDGIGMQRPAYSEYETLVDELLERLKYTEVTGTQPDCDAGQLLTDDATPAEPCKPKTLAGIFKELDNGGTLARMFCAELEQKLDSAPQAVQLGVELLDSGLVGNYELRPRACLTATSRSAVLLRNQIITDYEEFITNR